MTTANSILDICRGWLGYSEANGTFREILNVYNAHRPLARGYAIKPTDEWCSTFVSAVAIRAGATDIIPTEVSCERHIALFKSLGIWIEDGTITPQPGDIILFNWDSGVQPNNGYADHIGYVEAVDGGAITCIEGNKGEKVARRTIRIGHGNIRGYARPRYTAEIQNEDEGEPEMIYNYIDDNMPAWARSTIQKLVDKGYLKGNEKGELGLNDTMLKVFVVNDRAGLYQ